MGKPSIIHPNDCIVLSLTYQQICVLNAILKSIENEYDELHQLIGQVTDGQYLGPHEIADICKTINEYLVELIEP